MNNKKSNSIANITTQQLSPYNKPLLTNRMQQVYSNAFCDSGINSLKSKEMSGSDENDSLLNDKWKGRISDFRLRNVEENISDSIKTFLRSDEVQPIGKIGHFPVKNSSSFVGYVNNLLAALGSCMAANESCSPNDPQYDQMRRRYLALRWKSDTIRTLLTEYEELVRKTGGKNTAAAPLSASKSHSFSFLNLWHIGRRGSKETSTPLPADSTCDKVRMQEIENQIADLSGSIHLQLNTAIIGGNYPTTSPSYRFRLNIAQVDPERISSVLNPSSYRTSELLGRSSANILASPPHEWNFTVARRWVRSSNFMISDPSIYQSDLESWKFSSTERFLPMEPCATLVADVALNNKKKLRKSFDLRQFLTAEPQRIAIELTVMSYPYVELEVRWIPFTRLDLAALEKFPVSPSLAMDSSGKNSFEESSQGSSGAPIICDRRARGLSPPPGSEKDRDGGFESMSSQDIMASNDKLGLSQIRDNEIAGNIPSLLTENSTSETSISQHQQNSFRANGKYTEGEYESSANNEGDNTYDGGDLSSLISVIQKSIEDINRQPNRYGKLLNDLSIVIEGLQEQLTISGKFSANSLSKRKLPPRKVEHNVIDSISMLDQAIGESLSNFTSAVEAWTMPLSSGWDDLDSAIEWHLRNVSLLLGKLGSERIFIDTQDLEGSNNKGLLCIREDLIAMALDSQSEILSDITGLVLSYSESKEPLRIVLQSHCLAYCGTSDRGYPGFQNSNYSFLFPMSFWTSFVWQNANELLCPGSIKRLSTCGENIYPSLMIERENFQAYILREQAIPYFKEEDEQTLDLAIDALIEQITDVDLTDASPSQEIPLTQLCHRLRPQNFKVLTRFESLKSGSFNSRACASAPRPTQPTVPSLVLALEYLIGQKKLQHELRESDEEVLFRSLETLLDGLVSSNVSQDRRNKLMNISVLNFLCLALTLQHDDESVTKIASCAIRNLEELTYSAYGVILQSNQLPFLRTAGPCCSFLKSLAMFNQKIQSTSARTQARAGYLECVRGNSSCSTDGYNLISPIGSAVLWIMQCYDMEVYRVAGLAAWEYISTPAEASIGHSSSASRSALRNMKGHFGGSDDRGPIQAEVRRMNLSDDSAEVRQMALRILQARKKSRSIACLLDTPK
ncbi:unnamed protein product [Hymenolepis diminuta]|uniref:Uncharacterized protein n=1 Tax=Hymenolepis diminuta TaxID=6216 RepID=A0A564YG43_HYMDI|nr:unnamed protein product [Hymenolepis diminuta]